MFRSALHFVSVPAGVCRAQMLPGVYMATWPLNIPSAVQLCERALVRLSARVSLTLASFRSTCQVGYVQQIHTFTLGA